MGEGNENLVYPSPGTSRVLLHAVKSYNLGPSGFTAPPKEGRLRIFIALKKSIVLARFEPATFGSGDKHTNHYTAKATILTYVFVVFLKRSRKMPGWCLKLAMTASFRTFPIH
jgi:hypothetical protein